MQRHFTVQARTLKPERILNMIAVKKSIFLYSLLLCAIISESLLQSRRQLCFQRRWRICKHSPEPSSKSRHTTSSMQKASIGPEYHEHNSARHWQRDSSSAKMEVNQHIQPLVKEVEFHDLMMLLHDNLKSVPMPRFV